MGFSYQRPQILFCYHEVRYWPIAAVLSGDAEVRFGVLEQTSFWPREPVVRAVLSNRL